MMNGSSPDRVGDLGGYLLLFDSRWFATFAPSASQVIDLDAPNGRLLVRAAWDEAPLGGQLRDANEIYDLRRGWRELRERARIDYQHASTFSGSENLTLDARHALRGGPEHQDSRAAATSLRTRRSRVPAPRDPHLHATRDLTNHPLSWEKTQKRFIAEFRETAVHRWHR